MSFLPHSHPSPTPKLNLTTSPLPPYISPTQPPTKRPPFHQINSVPFISTTTLILPTSLYDLIYHRLTATLLAPTYAKIFLSLSDLLSGAIFTDLIKRPGSNLLALSEGVPGVDDRFELRDGVLRMELCKESYERAGLQGRVLKGGGRGGRKHVKQHWEVEVDLRKGSMVKGKKGFERLRYAAKEVLGAERCWVVRDEEGMGRVREVLEKEGVMWVEEKGEVGEMKGCKVPERMMREGGEGEEEWWEIVEWLDLVGLESQRVMEDDRVDGGLSRYEVPEVEDVRVRDLKIIRWQGLMSSSWVTQLLIEVVKQSRIARAEDWMAISVTSHETDAVGQIDGYTLLLQPAKTKEEQHETDLRDKMDTNEDDEVKEHPSGLQHCVCFQFVDTVIS